MEIEITNCSMVTAKYDALCATLDFVFLPEGQVWRFFDVPESVWYEWRRTEESEAFFHTHISGIYAAERIGTAVSL